MVVGCKDESDFFAGNVLLPLLGYKLRTVFFQDSRNVWCNHETGWRLQWWEALRSGYIIRNLDECRLWIYSKLRDLWSLLMMSNDRSWSGYLAVTGWSIFYILRRSGLFSMNLMLRTTWYLCELPYRRSTSLMVLFIPKCSILSWNLCKIVFLRYHLPLPSLPRVRKHHAFLELILSFTLLYYNLTVFLQFEVEWYKCSVGYII